MHILGNRRLFNYLSFMGGALILYAILLYNLMHLANIVVIERFISLQKLFTIGSIFIVFFTTIFFYLLKKKDIRWEQYIFYGTMFFGITGMLLIGYLTHGESIRSILINDKDDVLMDFFNSIQYGMKPYTAKVIYPPFINVLYGFLGRFVLIADNTLGLRVTQMGMLVFGTYIIAIYSALVCVFVKIKQGKFMEKIIFLCAIFLSLPFLFTFDRANSVVMVLFFLLVFMHFYQSKIYKLRLWAYVSLGIVAGIKISPVVFGALLLRKRCMKELLIVTSIVLLIFFLPFLLTDGNIFIMMHNIANTDNMKYVIEHESMLKNVGSGACVNLLSTFSFFGRLLNFNAINFAEVLNLVICFVGIMEVLFIKQWEKWKYTGLLCGILVLFPGFSAVYNLIYMTIPLLYFMDSHPKLNKLNVFYLCMFLGMFVPGINLKIGLFNLFMMDRHPLTLMTAIESLSVLAFMLVLVAEGVWTLYQERFISKMLRVKVGALACIVLCLCGVYAWRSSVKPIETFYPANMHAVNAQKGFVLIHGQYAGMQNEAEILLKSGKILYDGLSINFGDQENVGDKKEQVDIYINDQLVKTHILDTAMGNDYVYIPADYFQQNITDDTLRVKLVRKNTENTSSILPVNYIGYAQPLEGMPAKYIGYATKQMHQTDDHAVWAGKHPRILLEEDAVQQGLLLRYSAPKELFLMNPGRDIHANLLINGVKIKEFTIEKDGPGVVILNPAELPENIISAEEDDKLVELGIDMDASFTYRQVQIDSDAREKTIRIDYLGKGPKLKQLLGARIGKEERLYINTNDLDDCGLEVIYQVPWQTTQGTGRKLQILLDGKPVIIKDLPDKGRDYKDIVSLSNELFAGKDGIVELKMQQIPFSGDQEMDMLPDNKLEVQYIGALNKTKEIMVKDVQSKKDENKLWNQDRELFFDKTEKAFYMGTRANFFLWREAWEMGDLCLKYRVDPYLFEGVNGKSNTVSVWVNDVKVKDIVMDTSGEKECTISQAELLPGLVGFNGGYLHIELISDHVYNLKKMRISKSDELSKDRSIGISYFAWKN